PIEPVAPISPNRLLILLLAAFLGAGATLGVVLLLEHMDDAIWGPDMLASIQQAPPIGEIPRIVTRSEAQKIKQLRIGAAAAAALIVIAVIPFFHFFVMPIDVLWFVAMRRLGLAG